MKHEDKLELISAIDEKIIDRNTKKRNALWHKTLSTSRRSGRSKNVTIVLLAATLALTMLAFGGLLILHLTDDPALPPVPTGPDDPSTPTEGILSIELTSTAGEKSVYTITYGNGTTATLDITDNAPDGSGAKITGVTFDDSSNIYLSLATGKLLNMGRAVGQPSETPTLQGNHGFVTLSATHCTPLGNTAGTTSVTGVSVNAYENMTYHLNNGKQLALGKIHKKTAEGEDESMSMACINESGELVLGFASGETVNLGRVVGRDGKDGVGIDGINVTDEGELSVTLTNGTVLNLGNIKGIGIAESKINDAGELVLTYTDGNTVNLGRVVGEKGEDGVGIASININEAGELTISLTDGTNLNLGVIKGQDGKSAYELYKDKYGYEGTEKEWLFDLVNGNLATKVKYPVTFDSAGGSEVPTQEVEEGGKVIEPERPKREGYTFRGWYYGEELWSFAGYSVTEPITLTAKWEIVTYSITYSNVYPAKTEVGKTSYTLLDEIRVENLDYYIREIDRFLEGRTFLGWTYGNMTTPTKDLVIPKGTTGNQIVTAHWEKQEPFQFTAPFLNSCLPHNYWGKEENEFTVLNGADIYAVCDGKIKALTQHSNGTYTLILGMDYDLSGKSSVIYQGIGVLSVGITEGAHVSAGDVLGQAKNTAEGLASVINLISSLNLRSGSPDKNMMYHYFPGGWSGWEKTVYSSAYDAAVFLPVREGDPIFDAEATYHDGYVTLKCKDEYGDPSYGLGNQLSYFDNLQGKQYLVIKYRTTSKYNGRILFYGMGNVWLDADWENTGEWTFAVFDLSDVAPIQENSTVSFRIDFFNPSPSQEITDTFDLAYAAFFDSREEAESFMADFG